MTWQTLQKSSIFIGGSFKISMSYSSARVNIVLIANWYFCSFGTDLGFHFGLLNRSKSIHDRFDTSKGSRNPLKIDFWASKSLLWAPFWSLKSLQNQSKIALTRRKAPQIRSRSILELPRPAQDAKKLLGGSKTARRLTSDLSKRRQGGFMTKRTHSALFLKDGRGPASWGGQI